MPVHDAAARGFERGADDYEAARPSYPDALVDLLAAELGVGPDRTVLDLAAGTGKLTRLLAERGADLIAVEPVAAMRAKLAETVPGAQALEGTAEAIPLPDEAVDAVVVAQAFHWFDAPAALAEVRRVLCPNGGLAMVWNVRDISVDWVRRYGEVLVDGSGGDHPTNAAFRETGKPYEEGQDWVEVVAAAGGYTPLQRTQIPYRQPVDADLLLTRAASTSFVSALSDDDRERVLDGVRELVATHPDLRDNERLEFPYLTTAFWCHRA